MSNLKKQKLKIIVPIAAALIIVISIAIGLTASFLSDHESITNVVSVGKVKVNLTEGSYSDPSNPVPAGQYLPKAPKLTNNGINDEYVFIRVAVPKAAVTLLYDNQVDDNTDQAAPVTHAEGTKVTLDSTGKKVELFRTIAKGAKDGSDNVIASSAPVTPSTAASATHSPEIDINYNQPAVANQEGWVYLYTEEKSDFTNDPVTYQCYYFAYNKRLAKDEATINLFDGIQLKSFIDEEVMFSSNNSRHDGQFKVKVNAYAIQADDLGIEGLPTDDTKLTQEKLDTVFKILRRKQGETVS